MKVGGVQIVFYELTPVAVGIHEGGSTLFFMNFLQSWPSRFWPIIAFRGGGGGDENHQNERKL